MAEDAELPTIYLKMKNREKFEVEIDFRVPNPEYALLMLDTARRAIEREIRAMEQFSAMTKAANQKAVFDALRKGPGLVKPG